MSLSRAMSTYHDLIVPLAKELGVKDHAIEKWRVRGWVPHKWRLPLLEAARKQRKRLSARAFEGLDADVRRRSVS